MSFVSTRGHDVRAGFSQALREGLAPDGRVEGLPHDRLREVLRTYNRLGR